MLWSVGTKLGLGIGTMLVIISAVDVVSYSRLNALIDVAASLSRTFETLDHLDDVLLHLQNAETGQRGYLLTGEESYLAPYQAAVRSIDADLDRLRALLEARSRHAQREHLEKLHEVVTDKLAELEETIRARRHEGFEAARRLVVTDHGKRLMDRIRVVIEQMRTAEQVILSGQREAVKASARGTIGIIGAGSVLELLVLVVAGLIIQRDVAALRRAQHERMRLETSLRRSETMSAMGSLVAGVAHEVRNRLFGISSALDAMEARLGGRDEYRRYLDVLRAELDRLSRLMQQLLSYGKPPVGAFEPARVEDVIGHAVRSVGPLAGSTGVEIERRVPDDLPRAAVDGEQLLQVVQNVVENAIQHSPPGTVVTNQAGTAHEQGRRWIDITVQDCGPGFRPDDLPHVLDPVLHPPSRRDGPGPGHRTAHRRGLRRLHRRRQPTGGRGLRRSPSARRRRNRTGLARCPALVSSSWTTRRPSASASGISWSCTATRSSRRTPARAPRRRSGPPAPTPPSSTTASPTAMRSISSRA
jgi:CHASE3 domain sensor protein